MAFVFFFLLFFLQSSYIVFNQKYLKLYKMFCCQVATLYIFIVDIKHKPVLQYKLVISHIFEIEIQPSNLIYSRQLK